MSGIPVTIFDNHVRVPNGLGSFKNVSIGDFLGELQAVAAGATPTSEVLQSLRLPNEAVSIRFNKNNVDLLMYFPEARRDVRYGANTYNVPFPPILIEAKLKSNGKGGWTVERVRWFMTDRKEDEVPMLTPDGLSPRGYSNHLWCVPFPNQYGDGNMCVGANSYRSLYEADLRGLNELYHHILVGSPFNNDLWSGGTRVLANSIEAKRWFERLVRCESFPFGMLSGYPTPAAEVSEEEDDNE